MDAAYDHIQEQSFPDDDENNPKPNSKPGEGSNQASINADLQEAYKALSNSPWGARIGGFFGAVAKQGENVYREAQQEVATLGQEATRGWTDLASTIANRTRSLSLNTVVPGQSEATRGGTTDNDGDNDSQKTPTKTMSSDEALKESETVLSRLRTEATKRLKDIQKAEEAADEALLKFGANIRDFLKDAIQVSPPSEGQDSSTNQVLFESKDAQGKRVIHTSRFDAQMHVIHTNPDGFLKDPSAAEYKSWGEAFDAEKKTDDISADLSKYPELRSTMEKLVPDTVPYPEFWKRYYFLRHSIETAEARRRDLLKAAEAEEEVGWDEDSEDESDSSSTSGAKAGPSNAAKMERPGSTASSATIHPPPAKPPTEAPPPRSSEPRKSNDEASDTSYDMVGAQSGKPSQAPSEAPNSPNHGQKKVDSDDDDDDDDSDDSDDDDDDSEEDWE